MAYVPAGEDFDEDGFDFGDDDVQEIASDSSSCYPEPTLAQVYAFANGDDTKLSRSGGKKRNESGSSTRPNRGTSKGKREIGSLNRDEEVRVAAIKGKVDVITELLENGFNVNTPLKGGWVALMYACNHGNIEVVRLLLQHGANPNTQKDMFTALMAVGSSKSSRDEDLVECARALIDEGARPNAHDRHQMTSLLYACQSQHVGLVSFLISLSDVNSQDNYGWSALSYAAHTGNMDLVKQLLDAGANPELQTFLGDTPSSLAYSSNHTAVASLLDGANAASDSNAAAVSTTQQNSRREEHRPDDDTIETHKDPSTNNASASLRYGDIELFLMGLQLGHLVSLFKSHKIKFSDLLSMTDHDLERVGVTQVGVRKMILDSITDIHKSAWKMPPTKRPYNRTLSIQEYTVVVSQLTRHVSYIKGTILFLLTHVKTGPPLLSQSVPHKEQEELINRIAEVTNSMGDLQNQVHELDQLVQQGLGLSSQKQLSVTPKTTSRRLLKWRLLATCLVVVTTVGVAYSCYSSSLPNSLTRLLHS